MIQLSNIEKYYATRTGQAHILKNINLKVDDGEKICILGGNGSGKSTLIRLISGIERPSSGQITRTTRISWPLAFSGAFQGSMTGFDNMRFICRIYEKNFDEVIDFVQDFSQLGHYLREPLKTYSSGMRARLAFALSMMVDFDCYLIDEVVAVGDARFQQRCHDELFVRRADRSYIIVSHDAQYVREHCNSGCVLSHGVMTQYDSVDEAQSVHAENMR
ncbi:ATP-binding protein [Sphingomonas panacis]|uniref:ATP-binding protein n=1 Tax=Sphingomonas panacis TaxID=1560345 RepID=A0A1B3ZAE2_9SPHN|nr:ABC transporter ATP-binding protein [Sphingomonas panacis]AOH84390.1 ATP-binding protein [Sphingomonas panacis]